MDHAPKIETLSPAKQELFSLEKTGLYVFHGTNRDAEELHPKQAMDNKTGPDGDPAVFASTIAETAIFYAIMKDTNFAHGSVTSGEGSHVDAEAGTVRSEYRVKRGDFQHLKDDASGFVYVFKKEDFTPRGEMSPEHARHTPIQPIKRIAVSKDDLPKNIVVF